ncbi:MAG: hypothetical protein FD126_1283 [Elusimicrobia bacterium]|nr:MAG: hypothetical protein FD126_1283 [Elusimicrobiota bacterium]
MGDRRARALLLGAALAAATGVRAEEAPPFLGVPVPAPPSEAGTREVRWRQELADLYGTSPELVGSLRGLGLDHVETECAVAVSTRAQRPVTEVLELRKAGMEWADIARSYGFSLLEAIREPPAGRKKTSPRVRKRSRP